jgi:alpha-beta hydrolase superfamily lysophospholipase
MPSTAREDGRAAGVVLCDGFGGTMDRLFPHAEGFAEAGFAALVFDYRNFGASDGWPRQLVDIAGQQADLKAAIAFLRDRDEIDRDRVMVWGNSLGGAHVISVAADAPAIAAVVSQIPFNGFPRKVAGRSRGDTDADPRRHPVGPPAWRARPVAVLHPAGGQAWPGRRHQRRRGRGAHSYPLSEGDTLWQNRIAPRGSCK